MATSGKKHWPPMGRTQWPLTLVNSGVHIIKFWFSVSQREQLNRFAARETDPVRRCVSGHEKLPIGGQGMTR